jgi:ketosteroid isomerase-like protein
VSAENLEIVRLVYEAVTRHDSETVLALYDEEVEWDFTKSPFRDFFPSTVYRGHEGIRDFIRERYETWRSIEDDLDELIESGDHVISVITTRGIGRASGVEVELVHAGLWTLRDGSILRVAWLESREQALEAVAGPA